MAYCIVAPPQILKSLDRGRHLGPTHLLLAHDIVKPENQETYKTIFNNLHRHNTHPDFEYNDFTHVILDNGVIETGTAVNDDVIFKAAEIVRPSCIVLPDVLEDAEATIENCSLAFEQWETTLRKVYAHNAFMRDISFCYVPQGKTLKEFSKAADALSKGSDRIRYWGVPRNLVKNLGTRRNAIETVMTLNDRRFVHMMGFSDDIIDDLLCANILEVDTIDSAVPLRCPGMFSIETTIGPRGDWWETGQYNQRVQENIDTARRYFG